MNAAAAIALMIDIEGGYVDNPHDPGGATKYGITQRTLDGLRARFPLLPANVADLAPSQASTVYESVQWEEIAGNELDPALAVLALSVAVNMGEQRAILLLQDTSGIIPRDGVMGPGTLMALKNWRSPYYPGQHIAEEYAARAAVRYAQLYASEAVFAWGWYRRLFRVYTASVS